MSNQIGRYPSPLRYPGGKGKVANFMKLLLLENHLLGVEYVEPYAGGASVALTLLFEDYASHIHINDIDRSVHAFWSAVLDHTDELCARIEGTEVTVDQWLLQREVQHADAPALMDLAFSTFFLSRTNRSGIISGGIIGGLGQTGPWKLDARYNTGELVRRVRKVARFRSRITLTCVDASEVLTAWQSSDTPEALIYLDPPYYVKGEGLYENFYRHDHHAAIAAQVQSLAQPWVVSYDAVPEVLELYAFAEPLRYSLGYSAASAHRGAEVMYFSPTLQVPDVVSPAGISSATIASAQKDAFA